MKQAVFLLILIVALTPVAWWTIFNYPWFYVCYAVSCLVGTTAMYIYKRNRR